jgi:hypothetical protein
MPSIPAIVILLLICVAALAILYLLFVNLGGETPVSAAPVEGTVSVDAGLVTVRKVGPVTSVVIRGAVSDHWDGGGVPLPLLPVELTRVHEPELWAEYMSPETSAARKYDIIDEVYAKGFTLPYLRGLNEQYRRELAEGGPIAGKAPGRAPVNLTGKASLKIDESLREEPIPPMEDDPEVEPTDKEQS